MEHEISYDRRRMIRSRPRATSPGRSLGRDLLQRVVSRLWMNGCGVYAMSISAQLRLRVPACWDTTQEKRSVNQDGKHPIR